MVCKKGTDIRGKYRLIEINHLKLDGYGVGKGHNSGIAAGV